MIDNIIFTIKDTINRVQEIRKNRISISEISKCLRYSYYSYIHPQKISDKALIGIEYHNTFISIFAEKLENSGLICEQEYHLYSDLVGIRIDLLCLDKYLEPYMFEFKFTSVPYENNPYFSWYERQLKYYMALLLDIEQRKKVYGYLVLVNHDLSDYRVYKYEMNSEEKNSVIEEIKYRIEVLRKAKTENIIPPQEKGKYCNTCPYRGICFNKTLL
ncbi:MAG: PD-(D/E)XK nuclease family protein [Ignisphaera sp.]